MKHSKDDIDGKLTKFLSTKPNLLDSDRKIVNKILSSSRPSEKQMEILLTLFEKYNYKNGNKK
jgi:hypothetical protein